jgi:hypothetical protein
VTPLLVGFTYSNWVYDLDDHNSTVGYVVNIGSRPVTWDYKEQQHIYLSSIEVEYQEAVNAIQESLWLQ